jgi:hypothetical protein
MASLTVYADVIVPNSVIAAGVRGKQIRKNTRTTAMNGTVQVNIDWSRTLRQYELGVIPMPAAQWRAIEGLHEVTDGGAFGMLLQDPKDSGVLITEGLLQAYSATTTALLGTMGTGFGTPVHKLHKRYTSAGSGRTKDRAITRPWASSFVLKRGGSTVTLGAGAGNAALDATTGTVTFVADATSAATGITVGATTQVVTTTNPGTLTIGQRIYLTGFTGADAALVNGQSHLISNVTGAGPFTFTLATVTTGKALTWQGNFYVPVQFANDEIDWELVASGPVDARLLAGPSVTLLEVRE